MALFKLQCMTESYNYESFDPLLEYINLQEAVSDSFKPVYEGIGATIKNIVHKIIEALKKFKDWFFGLFKKNKQSDEELKKEQDDKLAKKMEDLEKKMDEDSKETDKTIDEINKKRDEIKKRRLDNEVKDKQHNEKKDKIDNEIQEKINKSERHNKKVSKGNKKIPTAFSIEEYKLENIKDLSGCIPFINRENFSDFFGLFSKLSAELDEQTVEYDESDTTRQGWSTGNYREKWHNHANEKIHEQMDKQFEKYARFYNILKDFKKKESGNMNKVIVNGSEFYTEYFSSCRDDIINKFNNHIDHFNIQLPKSISMLTTSYNRFMNRHNNDSEDFKNIVTQHWNVTQQELNYCLKKTSELVNMKNKMLNLYFDKFYACM